MYSNMYLQLNQPAAYSFTHLRKKFNYALMLDLINSETGLF